MATAEFAEIALSVLQFVSYPARLIGTMIKGLWFALGDYRDLSRAVHIWNLLVAPLEEYKDSPPRLKVLFSIHNEAAFEVEVAYKGGRILFDGRELSGQIDSTEPVICKPRTLGVVQLTLWVTDGEMSSITDEPDQKAWDFSQLRFGLSVNGLPRKSSIKMPKTEMLDYEGHGIYRWDVCLRKRSAYAIET